MLILNPPKVTFGSDTWENVSSLTIDRSSEAVLEWSDAGPHPVFADALRRTVTITVVIELVRGPLDGPRPGDLETLTAISAPATPHAGRVRLTALAMVASVRHEVSARRGAIRTVTLAAISPDGAADPVTIEPVPVRGGAM